MPTAEDLKKAQEVAGAVVGIAGGILTIIGAIAYFSAKQEESKST